LVTIGVEPDQPVRTIGRKSPALFFAASPVAPTTAVKIILDTPLPNIHIAVRGASPDRSNRRVVHPERPSFVITDKSVAGKNALDLVSAKSPRFERGGVVPGLVITSARGKRNRQGKDHHATLHFAPAFNKTHHSQTC
jgi:hypothetical protein